MKTRQLLQEDEHPEPVSEAKIKGLRALFLVWSASNSSHRSQFIAEELGIHYCQVYHKMGKGRLKTLVRYTLQGVRTIYELSKRKPRLVIVQNPPIFVALLVHIINKLQKSRLIIDSHTDALQATWWHWSLPLHRYLSQRAVTTIVTNEHLAMLVKSWGANAFVLPDPPINHPPLQDVQLDAGQFQVIFVSTVSYDEPIQQVLEAASRLPEVVFHVTGNYPNEKPEIVQSAPANVHFTGYLPDEAFYGLLQAGQVVMCLTTENNTMQSGANEALWLGKPIITSDWPILREYFSQGTVHVDNSSEAILHAILALQANLGRFEAEIKVLQERRRGDWYHKADELIHLIHGSMQDGG